MPVAAIAGEPGGFDRKYGPDAPVADRRQQSLEAGARDAAYRAAEIVIDNLDGSPAELFCATGKAVLAPQALLVVHKLIGGRLAHVDKGAAGEVVRRDLGHRRPPCPSAPSRSRAAAPRSTPPTAPAERESALFGARPLRTDLAVEPSRCASCLASCALLLGVAVGYVKTGRDRIEKDPDQQVQAAIGIVFAKFAELQSVRQVHLWLREEGIALPAARHGSVEGRIVGWRLPLYGAVHAILTNPVYAGAYAFGRTTNKVSVEEGRKRVRRGMRRPLAEWDVLLKDQHEGYIS